LNNENSERLKMCFRLEETKKACQLIAMCDPGLNLRHRGNNTIIGALGKRLI
jgi:hypothetical protein